ncbi:hypothetical protein L195_g016011 [Trifolium pratense]|uniref:Uncharacterized protein n=1 Tax=Trifolium pratense TaxID=57577 RepID=A0A2K3MPW9_TRIPR|nr:hypothetical protein L195_g016011 [Trifolium pratense]
MNRPKEGLTLQPGFEEWEWGIRVSRSGSPHPTSGNERGRTPLSTMPVLIIVPLLASPYISDWTSHLVFNSFRHSVLKPEPPGQRGATPKPPGLPKSPQQAVKEAGAAPMGVQGVPLHRAPLNLEKLEASYVLWIFNV